MLSDTPLHNIIFITTHAYETKIQWHDSESERNDDDDDDVFQKQS